MSSDKPGEKEEEAAPYCPQCGSDDTAPIHQEPMWVGSDQSSSKVKEEQWFRCLTCRYKWKAGEEE